MLSLLRPFPSSAPSNRCGQTRSIARPKPLARYPHNARGLQFRVCHDAPGDAHTSQKGVGGPCVPSVSGTFPPRATLFLSRLGLGIPKVYQLACQVVIVFFMQAPHTENERNKFEFEKKLVR